MSTYTELLAAIATQLTELDANRVVPAEGHKQAMLFAAQQTLRSLQLNANAADQFGVLVSGQFQGREALAIDVHGTRSGTWSAGFTDISPAPLTTVGIQAVLPRLTGTEALEIVSSSAADSAAGVGARTVEIYGNDADGQLQVQIVTLNGTTPVPLGATRWKAVNIMEVVTLGVDDSVPSGTIDVRTVSGATVIERIPAGINRSRSARFMVPTGYTGYIFEWDSGQSGSGAAVGQSILRTDTLITGAITPTVFHLRGPLVLPIGDSREQKVAFTVPAGATVKASAIATGSAIVDARFTIWLVANEVA